MDVMSAACRTPAGSSGFSCWILDDPTPVTNSEFDRFVRATSY